MIKVSVKFHEYIPYGLGFIARTQIFYHTCKHTHNGRTRVMSYGPETKK